MTARAVDMARARRRAAAPASFVPSAAERAWIWTGCLTLAAALQLGLLSLIGPPDWPRYEPREDLRVQSRALFVRSRFVEPPAPLSEREAPLPSLVAPALELEQLPGPAHDGPGRATGAPRPDRPDPKAAPVRQPPKATTERRPSTRAPPRSRDIGPRHGASPVAPDASPTRTESAPGMERKAPATATGALEEPSRPDGTPERASSSVGEAGAGVAKSAPTPSGEPQPPRVPNSRDPDADELMRWAASLGPLIQRGLRYPTEAERDQVEGTCLLTIGVAANGRIVEIHLRRSSGDPRLDRAALSHLRALGHLPPPPGHLPQRIDLPVRFTLPND